MATPHGNVSFLCTSLTGTITGVQWLVNNMILEDIDDTDITSEFNQFGGGIGSLHFTNIPLAYNETTITCTAPGEEEDTVSLLIQGSCSNIIIRSEAEEHVTTWGGEIKWANLGLELSSLISTYT